MNITRTNMTLIIDKNEYDNYVIYGDMTVEDGRIIMAKKAIINEDTTIDLDEVIASKGSKVFINLMDLGYNHLTLGLIGESVSFIEISEPNALHFFILKDKVLHHIK